VARSGGPALGYHIDAVGKLTSEAVTNSPDTDGDQLANFADEDDDNDGMPDVWESQFGLPLDAADATSDWDGDGDDALTEFLNGTDPTDAQSNSTPSEQVPAVPLRALLVIAALVLGTGLRQRRGALLAVALIVGLVPVADHARALEMPEVTISAVLTAEAPTRTDPGPG